MTSDEFKTIRQALKLKGFELAKKLEDRLVKLLNLKAARNPFLMMWQSICGQLTQNSLSRKIKPSCSKISHKAALIIHEIVKRRFAQF